MESDCKVIELLYILCALNHRQPQTSGNDFQQGVASPTVADGLELSPIQF